MSADPVLSMRDIWRRLVEPACTVDFEEYDYTPEEAEERQRRLDSRPTVEKGESDANSED